MPSEYMSEQKIYFYPEQIKTVKECQSQTRAGLSQFVREAVMYVMSHPTALAAVLQNCTKQDYRPKNR